MGGINPNRPDGYLVNRAVQEHCRALFKGVSDFFAAHAHLEVLVMAEADGGELSADTLVDVEALIDSAMQEFRAIEDNVSDEVMAAARSEGTWQADYFTEQLSLLDPVRAAAPRLAAAVSIASLASGASDGFQESFFHDGSNSAIRVESIEIVRAFVGALNHHLDVVVETNS